jgi:signal transduction histidine kinase
MRVEDGMLVLRVEDDGIGFDTKAARSAGHLGLANLHDRAAAFGGTVSIESTLGTGTTLSIRVPISSAEQVS